MDDCCVHALYTYHKVSKEQAENFQRFREGKTEDVMSQMDASWKKQVQENRRRLIPMIECVHHCGKQGLPLRAHRDHGPLCFEDPGYNNGNYRAGLRLRLQAGDEMAPLYMSKEINLLSAVGFKIK